MPTKSGSRELLWMGIGALAMLIAFASVLWLRSGSDPAHQLASKAKRLALLNAMRLSLAAASEAQNSAVMAISEEDSLLFAGQTKAATASLDRQRTELEALLKAHADPDQLALMNQATESLQEFQTVDKQLLDLAVQNTNFKAYNLAFGPAMKLLQQLDGTLSNLAAAHASADSDAGMQILRLASEVRVGFLRLQVLVLPHIAEESDQEMDQMEAQLTATDRQIRENLASLAKLLPASDQPSLEKATATYTEFDSLISQILKLSRENTDVRAVAIALDGKRKAMLACQDAMAALETAIEAEPIATTIPSGR